MAKQITLNSVRVQEIRIRPRDSEPNITMYYDLLDAQGSVVAQPYHHVKITDLPQKVQTAITTYLTNMQGELEKKDLQ